MSSPSIEADYLVVGAGTGGLAFADTLLSETNASIIIVDERARPGGHWNEAYRFVRLHQPSAYYGVNSTSLGNDTIDLHGPNAGYYELATGAEVCAYFENVMDRVLLPSGRVKYFPMCRYEGCGRFMSLVSGATHEARVRKRIVDTTYVAGSTPARHQPNYSIAPGVRHMPIAGLANLASPADTYVVVGAGKTGIDACLWLLARGVGPDAICWIMPQDAWLMNRALSQSGDAFFDIVVNGQMEAAAAAASCSDLLAQLEAQEALLRLDPSVSPTAYRCASVNRWELQQLAEN
jgi:hypothetical protein